MVEGGGTLHTQFLTAGLADELHLVVAPFFVGDARARRFVGDGRFPWHPDRRATLADVRQIGDVVLLRYALSAGSATTALTWIRSGRRSSSPEAHGDSAARIRTQVTVPLRFADGYATTARVFTFDGLVDGREHLAIGLGDRADAPGGRPPGVRRWCDRTASA